MIKIKRLFWKVFFAFWLTSISIMLATTYVVINSSGAMEFKDRYQEIINRISYELIRRYENGDSMQWWATSGNRFPRLKKLYKDSFEHRPLRIRDETGEAIFEHYPEGFKSVIRPIKSEIMGPSGKSYTVEIAPPKPKRFVGKVIRHLNTLQFIFILIGSTFVSLILSWTITRPLKSLGSFSRLYADGDNFAKIDLSLLERADELGDLARDIQFMTEQIEQNIQNQKQLLHDVSHELRAPLARLQAAAGLIQQKDESNQEFSDRIHEECQRVDHLLQRILDFSRMEQFDIDQTLDLSQIINEQIKNLNYEYPKRTVHFHNQAAQSTIIGHSELIHSTLENILRNACKYTPEDTPIDISLKNQEHNCLVTIRDYGAGIKESEQEKLLTPFYRAGNQMHTEGFGLGLSIAQRAMEKHQGTIHLQNHSDGGLEVTLLFPGK